MFRTHEIPFGLTRADRVLMPHAHPDDEILSAAAATLLAAAGVPVYTITATDGEASTKGDTQFVQAGRRREEAMRSFCRIGITEPHQTYLSLGDCCLDEPESREKLTAAISRMIADKHITALITPGEAGVDGHADHIAVHHAAVAAAGDAGRPVAIWSLSDCNAGEVKIGFDKALKESLAKIHHSQFYTDPKDRDELDSYGEITCTCESYDRTPVQQPAYAILAK